MKQPKLKTEEIDALYLEREKILAWLNPEVDPNQWPPAGWEAHPTSPGYFFRCVSEAELRAEVFGNPEQDEFRKQAQERVDVIEAQLIPVFFPKPKDEGTQRKTLSGFVAMLKTSLERKVDETAIEPVLKKCPKTTEAKVIKWTPTLKLKEYRDISDKTKEILEGALATKSKPPVFDIVKKPTEE